MEPGRRNFARGDERGWFSLARDVIVARCMDAEEHIGAVKGVRIEHLKYHCGAELVAPGGHIIELLGLQAVLDGASGITSISECLLGLLREHWGEKVPPPESGPCQMSVTDRCTLEARYQTTDALQVTHRGCISFWVALLFILILMAS